MSELDWIRTSTEVENTKSISFIPPLMRQCKTESKFWGCILFQTQLFFAKIWMKLQKAKWFYLFHFQFTMLQIPSLAKKRKKEEPIQKCVDECKKKKQSPSCKMVMGNKNMNNGIINLNITIHWQWHLYCYKIVIYIYWNRINTVHVCLFLIIYKINNHKMCY